MRSWAAEPHVRRWWDAPDQVIDMMVELMASDWAEPYLVEADGRPIAYLQAYDSARSGPDWPELPPGTWGLDTFIGPPDAIGRGYGSGYLRAFGDRLLARPGVERLAADPAPGNQASIRAFERAGFKADRRIQTPDGEALLMIRARVDR